MSARPWRALRVPRRSGQSSAGSTSCSLGGAPPRCSGQSPRSRDAPVACASRSGSRRRGPSECAEPYRGRRPAPGQETRIGVGNRLLGQAICPPQWPVACPNADPRPPRDLLVGLVLIGAPVEARPRAARCAASVVGRAPGAGLRGSQGLRPALLPLLRCGAVAPMRKFLCHPGAFSCGCWSRPCARGGLLVQGWESASHSQIVFDLGAPRGCRTT